MHNNGFLLAEIGQKDHFQQHFSQYYFLKPQLEAEMKLIIHQMHQLEKHTVRKN